MSDKSTIQIVALALALVVVGGVAGAIYLAAIDKTLPDLVDRMAMAALGALAALLASTRSSDGPPAPVTVVNADADPVPVETAVKRSRAKGPTR